MDVGHSNGWRLDDVVPAAEIVATIDAEMPLEPVDAELPGEVAERWRYRDGARRGRRHHLGHAAVLRRLHARAPLRRGPALHVPVRARAATTCARSLRGGATDEEIADAHRGALARAATDRYSELRTARRRALPKVEMSHIGG